MEKVLRPAILKVDPCAPDATKIFRHWEKTFANFIESLNTQNQETQTNKLAALINFVDASVYDLISDCTQYEEAIQTLRKTFDKKKNVIFARHLLATHKQEMGQPMDVYLQHLKNLAKDCQFEQVSAEQHREEAIRDAFISGLNSPNIRQRLLESKSLDLQTAYENARSLEMAEKQNQTYSQTSHQLNATSEELPKDTNSTEISTDRVTASAQKQEKCWFCGFSRHPRSKCPARDAICKKCHKKGHYEKQCLSKSKKFSAATNQIEEPTFLATIGQSLSKATIKVQINKKQLQTLVDTGSSENFISEKTAKELGLKILPSKTKITMAAGDLSKSTNGHVITDIEYKHKSYKNIRLAVLSDLCTEIILGHEFLRLHSKLEIPMDGKLPPLKVCNLAAANIEPPTLFGKLSSDCKPIATKSRRFSPADKQFISSEVSRLLKEDIIEPSRSPWRAQVLVTKEERHKKRLVMDYSQTINRFTEMDAYPQKKIDELVENISHYSYFSTLDLKSAYHQIPMREDERHYTAFEAEGNLYQFKRVPFGVTNGVACFQRVIDEIIRKENLEDTFAYVDNLTICGHTKKEHDENLKKFLEIAKKYGITFNEDKSILSQTTIPLMGYQVSKGEVKPDPERLRPLKELPIPKSKKEQEKVVGLFAYYSQWIEKFSEKAYQLIHNTVFPLPLPAIQSFHNLKRELEKAVLVTHDPTKPLVVETDASDFAIAATLNQNGRPVAFFSRTLNQSEKHHSPIEKEASAIVESFRKWKHYLLGNQFTLLTDQEALSFMYNRHKNKIKNDKIMRWKLELSPYKYEVVYRPGPLNLGADALSRCNATQSKTLEDLKKLHEALCHPGVARMYHFVRAKNLPFSVEDIRIVTKSCNTCAHIKPQFYKGCGNLIKATQPFERLSLDFKGPLPSNSKNRYLLTVVDEFSRFPFAFPCKDVSANTVNKSLMHLFSIFGMPGFIHSDRGTAFMSKEVKDFLHKKGVATSRTTPYNPQGNGQVERLNGTLWRTIQLCLKSQGLPINNWEQVLPQALHSIRSLLCTATNTTPHDRLFKYHRKSETGTSLPEWLTTPGTVLMKRNVQHSKYEPLVEEVELIETNPRYAHVKLADGRETTVSIRQLAPTGNTNNDQGGTQNETHQIQRPRGEQNLEMNEYIEQEGPGQTRKEQEDQDSRGDQDSGAEEKDYDSEDVRKENEEGQTVSEPVHKESIVVPVPKELRAFNNPGVQERNLSELPRRSLRNNKKY